MLAFAFFVYLLCFSSLGFKLEQSCSKFHYEEQTLEKLIRLQLFVEKVKEEMDLTESKVMDALADLTKEQETFQQEITAIKESLATPVVAFKSHIVSEKAMVDNKILVFTTTLLNQYDAYNNRTGVFTAPVDGVYLFTAEICQGKNVRSYFGFYIGDSNKEASLLGDVAYEACNTISTVERVVKGTDITVRCRAYCSSENVWENSYSKNSFSGVLIMKT